MSPSYRILPRYTRANIEWCATVAVHVEGEIIEGSTAALTVDEQALRNALSVNFKDLVFYDNAGNPTALALYSAQCLGGTRVTQGPDFALAAGKGPEFAVCRTFSFTVEGDVLTKNAANLLLEYEETVTTSGGTPYFVMKRAINNPPQRQLIWPQTEFVCIQQGRAVGALKYPTAPPPLAPGFLKEGGSFPVTSPNRTGSQYKGFAIGWAYRMESAFPLPIIPNFWPLQS